MMLRVEPDAKPAQSSAGMLGEVDQMRTPVPIVSW